MLETASPQQRFVGLSIKSAIVIAASALLWAVPARADGTVFRAKGCGDKVFVSSNRDDFSILLQGGGERLADGDELIGDVADIGHPVLQNRTTGRTVSVVVQDVRLDKTAILQQIAISCRAGFGAALVSGVVERATGCGTKIFVSTTRGYAILDRLSGGVVANGDHVSGDFSKPGRAAVKVRETGATLTVFVDDYDMSKSAVVPRMASSCRTGSQ